ncbi:helix-turn-helix domain-containing protein [uncultured Treponema sp.]|uniref:helix-turn-helix domain-containing protein n=1 Tax=uncultured Treponema sp. TaxID=162155 RepID=UPI002599B452|nr:helix-turn-helix domain-containing protein [uncultured Treponema sp.]
MNIKNDNYIQILGWMINELDLKGNELLVYALIHGFCQDGKSVFKGSLNYIMSWLNISKPTCIATIQSLIDKGLIVKTLIYNKNSVAGCEYYTTKSRNVETDQKNNSKNEEKGGKEILPPKNEKVTEGGKETLPGWSENFTRGGKETLPNNTNDNTKNNATAANKTDFEALSEKYFGKNAFDADFPRKAAAFFTKTEIKNYELYFDFIKNKLTETQNAKQVKNPRGLAYRLFFQPDIAQNFLEQQQNILFEKQREEEKQRKIEERKMTCPCCGKRFLPDFISSCPECDFAIDYFSNTEKVNVHKKFLRLPEAKKKEYQEELNKIYDFRNLLDFRKTAEQKSQERYLQDQAEKELNIKYGLVG